MAVETDPTLDNIRPDRLEPIIVYRPPNPPDTPVWFWTGTDFIRII